MKTEEPKEERIIADPELSLPPEEEGIPIKPPIISRNGAPFQDVPEDAFFA